MAQDRLMQDLARFIESHCEEKITLQELAKKALLSPHHLQRKFKEEIGVSPKEFQESCRLKKLKKGLRSKKTVTEAMYDSGYGSSSRLYEKTDKQLGMTPKQYQEKGQRLEISYGFIKTSLGQVLIAATDRGICFLQIGDTQKEMLQVLKGEFVKAKIEKMPKTFSKEFELWSEKLRAYLSGEETQLNLPLDIRGTAFQVKVWKYLQKIPYGKTKSYTEVAKGIGKPSAIRAVATACAKNNVALIIPCHRVLRGTGELAGYRWGVERKAKLLKIEKK